MKLIPIHTGTIKIHYRDMFANLPATCNERILPVDEMNRCVCSISCLLIQHDKRNILIDTGIGNAIEDSLLKAYDYQQEATLEQLLAKHNLKPEEITDVILTHLHFDHCGGCVKRAQDGTLALTFQNAVHYVSRAQWEWAHNTREREPDSFFEHTFDPILKNGKLNLVEQDGEILPGISVRMYHGHTRGLMIPFIKDRDKTIVYAGDLIPTSAHLPLSNIMSYDIDPVLTRKEKMQLLKEASEKQFTLMFQHEPI